MPLDPKQFPPSYQLSENDFFAGWEVSKRSASPEALWWHAEFLARKKRVIERARWWRAPDLRRRQIVVVL